VTHFKLQKEIISSLAKGMTNHQKGRGFAQVVHTKMCHVSKTTPILGVICYPFGKT